MRRTAARLFERRGYAATTISDIAEAAGILPGSLYHHFASKEDIAVDLLASYSRALAALGTAAVRRTEIAGDPEGLIRRLATDVARLAFEHAAAVRLSAYEAPSVATDRFTAAIQFRSPRSNGPGGSRYSRSRRQAARPRPTWACCGSACSA